MLTQGIIIKYASVLLSRQKIRPSASTPWVKASVDVIKWLSKHGYGLNSSTGMQTWEILTTLATIKKLPLRLFLISKDESDFKSQIESVTYQFNIDQSLTEFIPIIKNSDDISDRNPMKIRDEQIIKSSDILLPVSIRPGGGMWTVCKDKIQEGMNVDNRFEVAYQTEKRSNIIQIDSKELNPELRLLQNRFITHWTRAVNSAWPGERMIDLYNDLLTSDTWCRSGFETLKRIVASKRILSSGQHMPGNERTVSLSGLSPYDLIPLIQWRARYSLMSFEPYGVGIEKQAAIKAGVRKVAYYDQKPDCLSNSDIWLSQSKGKKTDWRRENEFRHRGDINLSQFASDELAIFCLTKKEAEELRNLFNYIVIAFYSS